MKIRNLFFAMASLVVTAISAQITFTASDVAIIGQQMTQVSDTLPDASIQAGPGGQNQTWNFSALQAHESYPLDFVAPSATPYTDLFPTADVASVENDSAFAYYEKDNDGLRLLGIYGSFTIEDGTLDLAVKNTPAMSILRFPTTFNDGYTEQYKRVINMAGADVGLPVDSFRVVSTVLRSVQYDAYGSLTTPAGTFDVLRIKETEASIDTTFVLVFGTWTEFPGEPITDIAYNFWTKQNGIGFPVASIQADEFGNTVSASYLTDFTVSRADDGKVEQMAFELFPNPCNDYINLDLPANFKGSVEVYDLMGREMLSQYAEGHFAHIATNGLPQGNYLAVLKQENQRIAGHRKFQVQR
jgi:hypothetical protein